MSELKSQFRSVAALLPRGSSVIYCDIPIFNNFGDILIMLGTVSFLRDQGITVRDSFGPNASKKMRATYDDSAWLLHGGGNFGDLYPEHQRLREAIIAAHPNDRIISFPQTLLFVDKSNLKRFARLAERHRDLHLMWRDSGSYKEAAEAIPCNYYLMPDMAHYLWPLAGTAEFAGSRTPTGDLFLIRRDDEAGRVPNWVAAHEQAFVDWRTLIPFPYRQVRRVVAGVDTLASMCGMNAFTLQNWSAYWGLVLPRLGRIFGGYERIVTSRLHAHIFACLLERQSVLLDNSYGKNRSYFDTWTHDLNLAHFEVSSAASHSQCAPHHER